MLACLGLVTPELVQNPAGFKCVALAFVCMCVCVCVCVCVCAFVLCVRGWLGVVCIYAFVHL